MLKIEIPLNPATKKNSQQIIKIGNRYSLIPSSKYKQYEKDCKPFIKTPDKPIDYPVNVKCTFYRNSRRRVDLTNLLECIDDVLVKYGVLEDDNRNIIASHDGSMVYYDKNNPKTIVEIEKIKDYQLW